MWVCPKRACRSQYSIDGPFLGGNKKVPPKNVLGVIYGWASGLTRKVIAKENSLTLMTVTGLTQKIEEMVAHGHLTRYKRAKGTWTRMQKDETAISSIKKRGSGHGKRVREKGVQWVHGLVSVDRQNSALEFFFLPVEDRTAGTLFLPVEEDLLGFLHNAIKAEPETAV